MMTQDAQEWPRRIDLANNPHDINAQPGGQGKYCRNFPWEGIFPIVQSEVLRASLWSRTFTESKSTQLIVVVPFPGT